MQTAEAPRVWGRIEESQVASTRIEVGPEMISDLERMVAVLRQEGNTLIREAVKAGDARGRVVCGLIRATPLDKKGFEKFTVTIDLPFYDPSRMQVRDEIFPPPLNHLGVIRLDEKTLGLRVLGRNPAPLRNTGAARRVVAGLKALFDSQQLMLEAGHIVRLNPYSEQRTWLCLRQATLDLRWQLSRKPVSPAREVDEDSVISVI